MSPPSSSMVNSVIPSLFVDICLLITKFWEASTCIISDFPHCIYPIANQKTFASLLVKLVLKIAVVDDMLPPKTIILTLVSVP